MSRRTKTITVSSQPCDAHRKTYIYRFKCCGRYMQWHNVETGEHWDGKPKKPKFVYVYRCSRCNRIVPFNPTVQCWCRYKVNKEWTRERYYL